MLGGTGTRFYSLRTSCEVNKVPSPSCCECPFVAHSRLWSTIGARHMVLNATQATAWETAVKWFSFILKTTSSKQRTGKQICPLVNVFPSIWVGSWFRMFGTNVNFHSSSMSGSLGLLLTVPPSVAHTKPLPGPATPTYNPAISHHHRTKELELSCCLSSQH